MYRLSLCGLFDIHCIICAPSSGKPHSVFVLQEELAALIVGVNPAVQFSSDQIDAILMEVCLPQQCCAWQASAERAEEALTSDASTNTNSVLQGHAALSCRPFPFLRVAVLA